MDDPKQMIMSKKILLPFTLLLSLLYLWACGPSASQNKYTNALINESSPYLLQHAHNPVNWYPWGEEALEKAKTEDKLLIISVGYAACHWCHVMEHESFEDTTVARIMNENFVCIKVDREERPDVDDLYMTACQLASERGCGWPLNAFALPDGRPVWAGTYFPKKEWVKVLEYFIDVKQSEPGKMEEFAEQLTQDVASYEGLELKDQTLAIEQPELEAIASQMVENMDPKRGGRLGSPKFPMPVTLEFLLQYYQLNQDEKVFDAAKTTLDFMGNGGIYDHLGGGFARYSTDSEWKVPHFEKMLYDNGQLVSAYAHAYQMTKDPFYAKIIRETLAYIEREMTGPEGGFYSSLDADSEGEEGKFYVWTKGEIDSILPDPKLQALMVDYYRISKKGNWEEHKNVLHHDPQRFVDYEKYGWTKETGAQALKDAQEKLFAAREGRTRPGLDDKCLTSWNAIMLKGYVDAYRALNEAEYLEKALKNAQFIKSQMMQEDGRLNRNFKSGESVINAFLDDYALSIQAFTALYQVTFDEEWLLNARRLLDYSIAHFSDDSTQLFFYTSDLDPPLIVRKKEISDNVIAASNSIMARNLLALGQYFYEPEYIELAEKMLASLWETISEHPQPNFYANWCTLALELHEMPYEVAILGPDAVEKRAAFDQQYLPNVRFLGGEDEGSLELLNGKLQEGETMIYVCQNKVCKFPVSDVQEALKLIK